MLYSWLSVRIRLLRKLRKAIVCLSFTIGEKYILKLFSSFSNIYSRLTGTGVCVCVNFNILNFQGISYCFCIVFLFALHLWMRLI